MATTTPSAPVPSPGELKLTQAVFKDGCYHNPWPGFEMKGFVDGMKMMPAFFKFKTPGEKELNANLPMATIDWDRLHNPPADRVQVTWIGHASCFVQMCGLNILTDPVFSERCSPSQWFGPKRLRPIPCKVTELPTPDIVIISHNHYDHLDHATVKAIGNGPKWFVPMGVKEWFEGVGITNVTEMTWWEEARINDRVAIACTPAQHFSNRGLGDRFKTLWCSWAVLGDTHRFFFSGDTAYCHGFPEIGAKYGPFDFSAIAIGAYEPRWFMRAVHINPEEAVQIHVDLKSKRSMGIHWGTFVLTTEPFFEPPQRVQSELERLGLAPDEFFVLKHGETKDV